MKKIIVRQRKYSTNKNVIWEISQLKVQYHQLDDLPVLE